MEKPTATPLASLAQTPRADPAPSDEEVVERVLAGELALYEVLMRRNNQLLYRTVRAILGDAHDVEDVLQDAYLAAYQKLIEFERRARFSTWLVRIAVNKALDRRRRRSTSSSVERVLASIEPTPASDPERQSAHRELAQLLEQAIDALPEPFRAVYVLREVEGLSTNDTASCLELEAATVKTRLHRARALLRERLACELDAAALQAFPFGAAHCDRLVALVLGRLAPRQPGAFAHEQSASEQSPA
jgi:RNA polymerase sigma-70 factor (ECF subfamily)